MHLIIRPYHQDDLPALILIERESVFAPWQPHHFQAETANAAVSRSRMRTALLNNGSIRSVAGYICFRTLWEDVYILKLSVAPVLRRRGIATALLKQALDEGTAAGAARAVLDVDAANIGAVQLYRKNGFKPADKNHVTANSITMERPL